MDIKTKLFIQEHIKDDVHQLALNVRKFPDIDMALALIQILGKQKIEHKVPTFFQCEDVLYPVRLSLEQSSSETTAKYKASLCEGDNFLDLTGGFGIDTFFISKKFNNSTYIERQYELCKLAEHNFKALNAENITIINTTAEDFFNTTTEKFDWIFIDPARRDTGGKKLVLLTHCEPDITKLLPVLSEKGGKILIKLSPMLDISATLQDISHIAEIHIVAIENECKEILLSVDKNHKEDIKIITINFTRNNRNQYFSYNISEERKQITNFTSDIKRYLYEPNAAVLKSGGFSIISSYYNIEKLHRHTHLYTSNELIKDFPGRIFEVKKVWENSNTARKELTKNINKANITIRNFPESADILRKKLKLSDGGECYLFACTLVDNEKKIIECAKL